MRRLLMVMVLAGLVPAPGCGGGEGGGKKDGGAARDGRAADGRAAGDGAGATRAVFHVVLGPGQLVPSLEGRAFGRATVTADATAGTLRVVLKVSGVPDATGATLALGAPGEAGRAGVVLAAKPFGSTLDVTVKTVSGGAFKDVAAAARAVIAGQTYLQVTSRSRPLGALRGHIGPAKLTVALWDLQRVPPPAGGGGIVGDGWLRLDGRLETVEVFIDPLDGVKLADVTGVALHLGAPGVVGPRVLEVASGPITLPFRAKVGAAKLRKAGGIATLADLRGAILSGRTYLLVTTRKQAAGLVRGHVGPATFFSVVSGLQLATPPPLVFRGSLLTTLNGAQSRIAAQLFFPSLPLGLRAATYHAGGHGVDGKEMFYVGQKGAKSPVSVVLAAKDLISGGAKDFAEAVSGLLAGQVHFLVWGDQAGKATQLMRGQVGPVSLPVSLSGQAEVPAVTSGGSGKGWVSVDAAQRQVSVDITLSGLKDVTGVHIHVGKAGQNGGILFKVAGASPSSPLRVTLTARDLQKGTAVATFPGAVDALLGGLCYLNVHTKANPTGELRGQIGAAPKK